MRICSGAERSAFEGRRTAIELVSEVRGNYSRIYLQTTEIDKPRFLNFVRITKERLLVQRADDKAIRQREWAFLLQLYIKLTTTSWIRLFLRCKTYGFLFSFFFGRCPAISNFITISLFRYCDRIVLMIYVGEIRLISRWDDAREFIMPPTDPISHKDWCAPRSIDGCTLRVLFPGITCSFSRWLQLLLSSGNRAIERRGSLWFIVRETSQDGIIINYCRLYTGLVKRFEFTTGCDARFQGKRT